MRASHARGALPALAALGAVFLASATWLFAQPAEREPGDKPVPFLSGRVVDEADLLPPEAEARLDGKLAELERATGSQVAVLTVESLDEEPIEDYSMRVAETWKLGRRGVDDGALLLIAERERQMRIEVGYGLEGALTDLESRQILDQVLRPDFRQGNFAGGIERGVEAIGAAIRGEALPEPEPAAGLKDVPWFMRLFFGFMFFVVVGTFSLTAATQEGCNAWGLYLFLMPFWTGFPMVIFGSPWAGLGCLLLWAIGFPLLRRWRRTPRGKRFWDDRMKQGGGFGGGWIPMGGGGFRGGGGGGFRGGGGGFGGGGSSGGW